MINETNEAEIPFVQCLVTCDNMSAIRGTTCYLPVPKARVLAARGSVRITEKLDKKVIQEYDDSDYMYRQKYLKTPLTRVAWVQNYNKNGGAEISNFTAIDVGKKLGFDVAGYVLNNDSSAYRVIDQADIIIVNNLHAERKTEFVDRLIRENKPFIKYDHDLCEKDLRVYKHSRLNIFISPLHKKHYVEQCGQEIEAKSICLPLAFDVDVWPRVIDGRIKNSVFVPTYQKCRDNALEYVRNNPDRSYYVSGSMMPVGVDVNMLGAIPYVDMPEQFQKYETVLHLPQSGCAGERVLFEAVMSGCKVICNDNCGHASWDFDWRDDRVLRPILKRAIYQFWREVERVINEL